MEKILVTGSSGLIGGELFWRLHELKNEYDVYALDRTNAFSPHSMPSQINNIPEEKFLRTDLSNFDLTLNALKGFDTVVHLAAIPNPRTSWENILNNNLVATYNVFEASRQAGIKRIILASSIRVSLGYYIFEEPYKSIHECRFSDVPEKIPLITHKSMPRPTEAYGASKLWGENIARVYSEYGISCICLRIGAVSGVDHPRRSDPGTWCSKRDITQMIRKCIDAPREIKYDIFYCVSESRFRWVDLSHAAEVVGYVPEDDEEKFLHIPGRRADKI